LDEQRNRFFPEYRRLDPNEKIVSLHLLFQISEKLKPLIAILNDIDSTPENVIEAEEKIDELLKEVPKQFRKVRSGDGKIGLLGKTWSAGLWVVIRMLVVAMIRIQYLVYLIYRSGRFPLSLTLQYPS